MKIVSRIYAKEKGAFRVRYTLKRNDEMEKIRQLINEKIVERTNASKDEPYQFKLTLTEEGKILLKNLYRIKDMVDE